LLVIALPEPTAVRTQPRRWRLSSRRAGTDVNGASVHDSQADGQLGHRICIAGDWVLGKAREIGAEADCDPAGDSRLANGLGVAGRIRGQCLSAGQPLAGLEDNPVPVAGTPA